MGKTRIYAVRGTRVGAHREAGVSFLAADPAGCAVPRAGGIADIREACRALAGILVTQLAIVRVDLNADETARRCGQVAGVNREVQFHGAFGGGHLFSCLAACLPTVSRPRADPRNGLATLASHRRVPCLSIPCQPARDGLPPPPPPRAGGAGAGAPSSRS